MELTEISECGRLFAAAAAALRAAAAALEVCFRCSVLDPAIEARTFGTAMKSESERERDKLHIYFKKESKARGNLEVAIPT